MISNCLDCGRQVSTRARACPGCGRRHPLQPTWVTFGFGVLRLALWSTAAFLTFVVLSWSGCFLAY